MATRQVTIGSTVGLHARPASLFVKEVGRFDMPITIAKGDKGPVDAKSMLGVMSLAAKCGDTVTLTADGDDAEEALEHLATFLAENHDAS